MAPSTPDLPSPDRDAVIALLAGFGDRDRAEVGETLDSLELTWLVAQVEQRYGVELDLTDEVFAGMGTVTGAVDTLAGALDSARGTAAGHG
ncbi:hypothetical protein V5P93_004535 [Actinokineospora auranticolor]|uniref:Acyl carrier protein n=1 Tax=Actinokineospora auranticolor TaxID=155976 RepID=A0A2S6GT41_9PSEU|nr:hypothetical protein [Actinokineospora auranticolor]PPK68359.1 hypothetical protein CLV40_10582 [Actinokineospora auranticolor]